MSCVRPVPHIDEQSVELIRARIEIKQHVQSALDWEPSLDASDAGVSVDEGVVSRSFPESEPW